jgi:hypothetical protein
MTKTKTTLRDFRTGEAINVPGDAHHASAVAYGEGSYVTVDGLLACDPTGQPRAAIA